MSINVTFNKHEFEKKKEMVVLTNQTTKIVDRFIFPADLQLGIPDLPRSIKIFDGTPSETTNKLYNVRGSLYFNGSVISGGGGGASDAFKTISVSGQTDVVADSSTDTLTFAAGTGITITTNAGSDTITITGNVGDITGVTAGDGLSGGGTSGTVSLALDINELTTRTDLDPYVDYVAFSNEDVAGDPSHKALGVELARALVETEDVRVATQMFM